MPDVTVEHTATGVPEGHASSLSGSSPAHAPSGPPRDHRWTPQRLPVVAGPSGPSDVSPQPPSSSSTWPSRCPATSRDHSPGRARRAAEVDELATFLAHTVRTRPRATPLDDEGDAGHSPGVTDRLLVTKEAAGRLGVSVRTIERLVVAGRLPLVHVERAAPSASPTSRAFVHDLSEEQATECDTDPSWPGKKRAAELARPGDGAGVAVEQHDRRWMRGFVPTRREVF